LDPLALFVRECRKTGCGVKNAGVELLSKDLIDALSLTRERVGV
jgi:hypothetical protein